MNRSKLFMFLILFLLIAVRLCVEIQRLGENAGDLEYGSIRQSADKETVSINQTQQIDLETAYEMLNKDFLRKASIKSDLSVLQKEISRYAGDVNVTFEPIEYKENIFPSELILLLEEKLYGLKRNSSSNDLWYESLKELKAGRFRLELDDMYRLFPALNEHRNEIKTEYDAYNRIAPISTMCTDIFHINMNSDDDNYIFVYWGGGTDGTYFVLLTNRVGDEFIEIENFQIQNGDGTVIQYEEYFYYIYRWKNYNLKCSDGLRIHRFGANAADENVLIRYLPELYIWKNIYKSKEIDFECELENYIDNIKSELTSDKYLENGMQTEIGVYYGDEKVDRNSVAGRDQDMCIFYENYKDCCKIDSANLGIPVYIKKSNFIPSNGFFWHVRAEFYLYDGKKGLFMELENMELNDAYFPSDVKLVQIWYKEIKQKVLTFRLYHISDYNYVLNVILIEGNKVTQIREDIVLPQYKFTVTEGSVFHTG